MKKKIIFLYYLLNEKWNSFRLGFLLIIGWVESGKAILYETLCIIYNLNSVSSLTACCLVRSDKRAVEIFFRQRWQVYSIEKKEKLFRRR